MLELAIDVLNYLGIKLIYNFDKYNDPQTEEELAKLEYDSPNKISWIDYINAIPEVKKKRGLEQLRNYRNKLLKDTDWIMTYDNSLSLANYDEWAKYRQGLRDITEANIEYIWNGNSLDFSKMHIPKRPEIIRKK